MDPHKQLPGGTAVLVLQEMPLEHPVCVQRPQHWPRHQGMDHTTADSILIRWNVERGSRNEERGSRIVEPIHSYPFLSIPIHSYPFLSTPIHSYPFLSIPIHSYPFLSIPIHSYPFLSTPIHSYPFLTLQNNERYNIYSYPHSHALDV